MTTDTVGFARVFAGVVYVRIVDDQCDLGLIDEDSVFETSAEDLFVVFVPTDFGVWTRVGTFEFGNLVDLLLEAECCTQRLDPLFLFFARKEGLAAVGVG